MVGASVHRGGPGCVHPRRGPVVSDRWWCGFLARVAVTVWQVCREGCRSCVRARYPGLDPPGDTAVLSPGPYDLTRCRRDAVEGNSISLLRKNFGAAVNFLCFPMLSVLRCRCFDSLRHSHTPEPGLPPGAARGLRFGASLNSPPAVRNRGSWIVTRKLPRHGSGAGRGQSQARLGSAKTLPWKEIPRFPLLRIGWGCYTRRRTTRSD